MVLDGLFQYVVKKNSREEFFNLLTEQYITIKKIIKFFKRRKININTKKKLQQHDQAFSFQWQFDAIKKYDVDLYEKEKTILCGASWANRIRFHLGYNYPRSLKALKEVNELKDEFTKFYGNKIFDKTLL